MQSDARSGVLGTADIHLTSRPVDEYRWAIFPWLVKQATKRRVRGVVIAGDLTDQKDRHDAVLVNRLVESIGTLVCAGLDVAIIAGNHDYRDPGNPFFRWMSQLQRVRFFEAPAFVPFAGFDTVFLPHTRNPENAWTKLANKHGKAADLCVFHGTVRGSVASNGEKMEGNEAINAAWFTKRFDCPILGGDIHVPQPLYCGAPHPVRFGDDFKPRVLWIPRVGAAPVSIPRASIRKLNLQVDDAEEMARVFSERCRDGDQLRLHVCLGREAMYQYPEMKKAARRMAREHGVELHSVEPVIREVMEGPSRSLKPAISGRPARTLKAFEKDPRMLRAGLRFLAHAGTVADEASPGDYVPVNLRIQGFKSYGPEQILQFKGQRGLIFISGRNADAPRLGSNASGKSSIPDAWAWCLFGQTLRGVRGPAVVNWSGEHACVVTHTWRNDRGSWTVTRGQAPNILTLQHGGEPSKVVTDDDVAAALGMNREQFGFQVAMGQFGEFFFDMGDTDRLRVFSDALRLRVWEDAAEAAKTAQTKAQAVLDGLEGKVQRQTGVAAEALSSLRQHKKVKAPSAADVSRMKQAADAAQAFLAGARSLVADLEKKAERCRNVWKGHADTLVVRDREKTRRDAQAGELSRRIADLKRQKAKLENGLCPSCGRSMPDKDRAIERLGLDGAEQELGGLVNGTVALTGLVAESHKAVDAAQRASDAAGAAVKAAQEKERKAADACSAAFRAHDAAAAARANHRALVDGRRKAWKAARAALRVLKKLRDTAGAQRERATYWRDGFKRLRFQLVKSAVDELALYCNAALGRLGLPDWTLDFEVEQETGKGTVSSGFFTYVRAPGAPDRVPWRMWCGGETQRLRLAGAEAFGQLLAARRGVRTGVELWDEPTAHLSPEGVGELVDFLRDRAVDDDKLVFLIDHRAPDHGGFHAEYRVIKRKGESRIRRVAFNHGE